VAYHATGGGVTFGGAFGDGVTGGDGGAFSVNGGAFGGVMAGDGGT
jgi:hypothetical protein